MQILTLANNNATFYAYSEEFFELFEAGSFDLELRENDNIWLGIVFAEVAGKRCAEIHAYYVYEDDAGAGWGWHK
jgi:hypothetical protein